MRWQVFAPIIAVMFAPPSANARDISDIAGYWRTVRHSAIVEIVDCGDGSPCGYLIWADAKYTSDETRDVRNKDKSLRDRPLRGLPILWGYDWSGEVWRGGRLYNPDDGKTFWSSLELVSEDELKVKGCIGPLCRQQNWQRLGPADPNLKIALQSEGEKR
jgi:uncharacterized protein (DUF2147 family)